MRFLVGGFLLGALTAAVVQRLRRGLADRVLETLPPIPSTRAASAPSVSERNDAAEQVDLSSLTAAELYRRAQAAGIRGRAGMTKAQLIEALRAGSG